MDHNMNYAQVNVHQIRQKVGSKKELYDFLSQDCNAYIPKITCTNIYFLKAIINGEKNYLKRNEVIITAVPQIEGLTADDFIKFAENRQDMLKFLPDQCDWIHLDKRWICDVLMSLDREGISEMIHSAKGQRLDRINKSQNLMVTMRPEFAQALQNSLQFSQQRGRSAYLLKATSQRKRRQREIEEVKGEEVQLNQSKQKYLEQNKRVRQEMDMLREQLEEFNDYKQVVMNLHQAGIINEEGNPLVPSLNFNDQNNNMQ